MDTSKLAFPKGRPRALDKAVRRKALEAFDTRESAKVKVRSGGRCEVFELPPTGSVVARCPHRATEVHHMIGGWGKRARGMSVEADCKQHVCHKHHTEITGHVLTLRSASVHPRWDDYYVRAR